METMKKKLKIIVSMVAVIIVLLVIWFIRGEIRRRYEANRVPFLKVMTETSSSWNYPGSNYYYTVYEDGEFEKIDKFPLAEVETYDLYLIEDKLEGDEDNNSVSIPPYAREIIELTKERGSTSSVLKLFIINNRYFFDFYNGSEHTETLFEYLPDKNLTKEIVQFDNSGLIRHIEFYEPE